VVLNVLLVGSESAAIQVLRGLVTTDHRIVAVLADDDPGRAAGLGEVAVGFGLPVLEARRVRDPDFAGWIDEHRVDLLLNVHSLSIAHPDVVRAPRIGSFNLHPGPLPAYAGLNVVSWAIYRGEREHGVTLHWMDPEIDMGPIAYRAAFDITDEDTGLSVFTKCVRLGVPLVFSLLDAAARDPDSVPAEPQRGERTLYRRRDVPQEGRVDWTSPARRIHDFVRACDFGPFSSPWGRPTTRLDGLEVGLVRTLCTGRSAPPPAGTIGEPRDGAAMVATGDEWLGVRSVAVDHRSVAAVDVLTPGTCLETDGPTPPDRGP
jgi:UDP-4-amino-4-deoxy-L-arabinose formyltransferase/UDP-glucuronic acid dehydrogenase (UDP-4-keto-hexauronic acid decarboxylating)